MDYTIKDKVLYINEGVKKLDFDVKEDIIAIVAPDVEIVTSSLTTSKLKWVDFPKLKKVGNDFLMYGEYTKDIKFPMLEEVGNYFMAWVKSVNGNIDVSKVKTVGDYCLSSVQECETFHGNNITSCGIDMLADLNKCNILYMRKLRVGETRLLSRLSTVKMLDLSSMTKAGDNVLSFLRNVSSLRLNKLKEVGADFMSMTPGKIKELMKDNNIKSADNQTFWDSISGVRRRVNERYSTIDDMLNEGKVQYFKTKKDIVKYLETEFLNGQKAEVISFEIDDEMSKESGKELWNMKLNVEGKEYSDWFSKETKGFIHEL